MNLLEVVSVLVILNLSTTILPVWNLPESTGTESESTHPGGRRNTEWLEETIDQFLQQAENNGEPTEVQVSSCKISNQQLVASAQATIARVLKGFCNPNELEDKFSNLETQLGDQLNVIKTMLLGLEDKVLSTDREIKGLITSLKGAVGGRGGSRSIPPIQNPVPPQELLNQNEGIQRREQEPSSTTEESDKSSLINALSSSWRYSEIAKYNSTVSYEAGKRVFTYYWALEGMDYKLKNWGLRRHLRSPSFYVSPRGYRMYLKLIPRSTPTTTYIHTGLTKGDYDQELTWPFVHKLRITVLSQRDASSYQDLKSRLWDPRILCSGSNWSKPGHGQNPDNPECLGLGFPHDVIHTTGADYIQNDQMIIKLSVYLD